MSDQPQYEKHEKEEAKTAISNAESNKGPEQETSQNTHQENGPHGSG